MDEPLYSDGGKVTKIQVSLPIASENLTNQFTTRLRRRPRKKREPVIEALDVIQQRSRT